MQSIPLHPAAGCSVEDGGRVLTHLPHHTLCLCDSDQLALHYFSTAQILRPPVVCSPPPAPVHLCASWPFCPDGCLPSTLHLPFILEQSRAPATLWLCLCLSVMSFISRFVIPPPCCVISHSITEGEASQCVGPIMFFHVSQHRAYQQRVASSQHV